MWLSSIVWNQNPITCFALMQEVINRRTNQLEAKRWFIRYIYIEVSPFANIIYMHMHIHTHIYIYIRHLHVYIYICICICICIIFYKISYHICVCASLFWLFTWAPTPAIEFGAPNSLETTSGLFLEEAPKMGVARLKTEVIEPVTLW